MGVVFLWYELSSMLICSWYDCAGLMLTNIVHSHQSNFLLRKNLCRAVIFIVKLLLVSIWNFYFLVIIMTNNIIYNNIDCIFIIKVTGTTYFHMHTHTHMYKYNVNNHTHNYYKLILLTMKKSSNIRLILTFAHLHQN